MPTYEYRCKDCGHEFETVQSFSDEPLTECPSCHGQLRKVFGSVGISFKGSGFYKTDSQSSSARSSTADASSDSAGSTSTSTSTESSEGSSSTSDSGAGTKASPKSDSSTSASTTAPAST